MRFILELVAVFVAGLVVFVLTIGGMVAQGQRMRFLWPALL